MVKKGTKKKIALGTAAAIAGGAAAMAHPKVRKGVSDKAKDVRDKMHDN